MALSLLCFSCPQQRFPPVRLSRSITRSNFQNSIFRSIGHDKCRAAHYLAAASSPKESSPLPNGLDNFTDCFDSLHARTLRDVRHLVGKVEKGSLESLLLADALQRLGIDYRFEEEMQSLLREQFFISTLDGHRASNNSLHEVALRFRLLRQEGYNVPADIFEGFKKKDDNSGGCAFDPKLSKDIFGLMSLHEASHLATHGEGVLDEAADFTRTALSGLADEFLHVGDNHINGMSSQLLGELVRNTLSNPIHKSLPRFTSKSFEVYLKGHYHYEWTRAFRELAILDADLTASISQTEIRQISKWWRDLGLANELKFARDQPLKWYFWPMAVLRDRKFSQERVDMTKPISMVYIIDDIFDVRGSLDELTLFAEAITRWECVEELPDYMKTCFRALDSITNEICSKAYKKHGGNPTDLLRKSWANLCDAFLVEKRWFTSRHSPSADEYLNNAMVSTGVHLAMAHLFTLLCGGTTKQSLEALNSFTGMSASIAKILRLWDDLGSAKDENQEGHDGSYVDYYMKENPSCSLDGARDHVKEMISGAWKSLNRECLFPRQFPPYMAKASLNTARMIPLMYEYDKNHRLPRIEEYMKSLLLKRSA